MARLVLVRMPGHTPLWSAAAYHWPPIPSLASKTVDVEAGFQEVLGGDQPARTTTDDGDASPRPKTHVVTVPPRARLLPPQSSLRRRARLADRSTPWVGFTASPIPNDAFGGRVHPAGPLDGSARVRGRHRPGCVLRSGLRLRSRLRVDASSAPTGPDPSQLVDRLSRPDGPTLAKSPARLTAAGAGSTAAPQPGQLRRVNGAFSRTAIAADQAQPSSRGRPARPDQ